MALGYYALKNRVGQCDGEITKLNNKISELKEIQKQVHRGERFATIDDGSSGINNYIQNMMNYISSAIKENTPDTYGMSRCQESSSRSDNNMIACYNYIEAEINRLSSEVGDQKRLKSNYQDQQKQAAKNENIPWSKR